MGIFSIDHIYVETRSFPESLAFWQGLGFDLVEEWGEGVHRAARLQAGEAAVVLATGESTIPAVFFGVSGINHLANDITGGDTVTVRQPLESTHWGTQWIRVADPSGNIFALEESSPGRTDAG